MAGIALMLERKRPDPIPAIDPVPEYRVEGRAKDLYDDAKSVLQVPWMGVVTMALAHYLPYYEVLWRGAAPILASEAGVAACRAVRRRIEREVAGLAPPARGDTLRGMGYAPREIDNIRDMLEVFSHGNFPYLLLVTLSRLALEAGAFPDRAAAAPFRGRHARAVEVPFVLMEEHHAGDRTRAVYASIRRRLGLPFVNTDYRALARWPSYFRLAWRDLEPHVTTAAYEDLVSRVHAHTVEAAMTLPNPTGLTAGDLAAAADRAASVDEILAVTRLFQWLLPGLVANVAFFRAQLR